MRRRRMCRSYQERSVPRAHLHRILDSARRAPSAGHSQGVRFAVVTGSERRRQIAAMYGEARYLEKGFAPWLSVAPVHLVVAVEEKSYEERYSAPDKRGGPADWEVSYPILDAGKALMALYLAAENYGLSAGFLGSHAGPNLVKEFDLPSTWRYLGLVTLGYPAGAEGKTASVARGRRRYQDVVRWL